MGSDACRFAVRHLHRPRALCPIRWAAALTAFLIGVVMISAANAQPVMGWIELKPGSASDTIQIIGHALAFDRAAGTDFSLSVQRSGPRGRSNSLPSGRVDLAIGETKILATASVNVMTCDDLMIELKLPHQGLTISRTAISKKPAAEALPDYRLKVRFLDGLEGIVDMRRFIFPPDAGVFAAFSDTALFGQVYLEYGAVTWPAGIDLAPAPCTGKSKAPVAGRRSVCTSCPPIAALQGSARNWLALRSARHLLGAGEMGGKAPRAQDGCELGSAQDQHGGGPRRRLGRLRPAQGGRAGLCLRAEGGRQALTARLANCTNLRRARYTADGSIRA
jgi:hypothetical protein